MRVAGALPHAVLLAALLGAGCSAEQEPTAADDPAVVERQYNRSCAACHASGAAGAYRTGDAVAWAPVLAKGMDMLLANVRSGYRSMPPMGLCNQCSDEDFRLLIRYMAQPQN